MENNAIPTSQTKWQREGLIPDNFVWSKTYKMIHKITKDTQLMWFQYRIQHRILATNTYLKTIGIKNVRDVVSAIYKEKQLVTFSMNVK